MIQKRKCMINKPSFSLGMNILPCFLVFLTSNSFSNLHNKGMLACSTLHSLQHLLVLNANCKYSQGIFEGAKDSTIEVELGMQPREDRVAEIWRLVIKSCRHRGTNK